MDLHPDFRDLLAEFVRSGVRFVLVGSYGVDTEEVIGRAETLVLDDLVIPVIGLDDLIANKRACGRRRDLADVELLERVRRRR